MLKVFFFELKITIWRWQQERGRTILEMDAINNNGYALDGHKAQGQILNSMTLAF